MAVGALMLHLAEECELPRYLPCRIPSLLLKEMDEQVDGMERFTPALSSKFRFRVALHAWVRLRPAVLLEQLRNR